MSLCQNNHVWGGVCRTFVRKHPYETLNEQEKEKWKELEERICVKETALQQQFERFVRVLDNKQGELKAVQKSTLQQLMRAAAETGEPEYVFGKNFMQRSDDKLDGDMEVQ